MASKSGLKFSEQTVEAQRVSYFFIFITSRDMLETELQGLQKDQSILPFFWAGTFAISFGLKSLFSHWKITLEMVSLILQQF